MKTIGIKLADGSFFPVLKEGKPEQKKLELTTAHNNQTRVMVDLYRSKTASMDDAEYVDTLQIDNINEHPRGAASIVFNVAIDENNELSANIIDEETGATSMTTIELVNRTLEERMADEAAAYDIAETTEEESEIQPEAAPEEETVIETEPDAGMPAFAEGEVEVIDEPAVEDTVFDEVTAEETAFEEINLEESATEGTSEELEQDNTDLAAAASGGAAAGGLLAAAMLLNEKAEEKEAAPEEEPASESVSDGTISDETFTDDTSEDFTFEDTPSITEDFDLPDFGDSSDSTETFEETPVEASSESESLFDLPDFEEDPLMTAKDADPDFFSMDDENSKADEIFGSSDHDLFGSDSFDSSESATSNELFFDEPSAEPASGGISFTGLYDKETEMGDSSEDETSKKTRGPVIICVVCAIICIIAVLLILFVIPSKLNILKRGAEKEAAPVEEVIIEPVEEPEPEPEPVPSAKEDEVIIIEEAEVVVPEPPAPPKPEPKKDIVYKIKWGDTLWDIADTYYKNPWRYHKIARYNGIKDPDYIISGTKILIPQE